MSGMIAVGELFIVERRLVVDGSCDLGAIAAEEFRDEAEAREPEACRDLLEQQHEEDELNAFQNGNAVVETCARAARCQELSDRESLKERRTAKGDEVDGEFFRGRFTRAKKCSYA